MNLSSFARQKQSDSSHPPSVLPAWGYWAVLLLLSSFVSPNTAAPLPKSSALPNRVVKEPVVLAQNTKPASTPKETQPAKKEGSADSKQLLDSTFDDLKFDIEKDAPFKREMLPEKIENYAGRRMRIRGFILPTSFQTGLTNFVLVRDNMECCFGPGAALYDCIVVEMSGDKTTDYTIRPVAVEGTFKIDEFIGPGRKHLAIYKLIADKVE